LQILNILEIVAHRQPSLCPIEATVDELYMSVAFVL